jgi:hypothetical protein
VVSLFSSMLWNALGSKLGLKLYDTTSPSSSSCAAPRICVSQQIPVRSWLALRLGLQEGRVQRGGESAVSALALSLCHMIGVEAAECVAKGHIPNVIRDARDAAARDGAAVAHSDINAQKDSIREGGGPQHLLATLPPPRRSFFRLFRRSLRSMLAEGSCQGSYSACAKEDQERG